jgi:hypothetical protein
LEKDRRMSAPTPTDFPGPDSYYTPEPGGLLFGVEPMIALCGLLILLAVAVLAYYLGARRFSKGGGSDETTDAIYVKILKASHAALSADSNHLRQKAQDLKAVINKQLGPVIVVGTGVGGPLKQLDEALKGKIKVAPSGHAPAHEPHRPHDTPPASGGGGGGGGAAAASHVTVISLPLQVIGAHAAQPEPDHGGGAHAGHGHSPAAAHAPAPPAPPTPPPEFRDMTVDEQIDALARAVRKFNDHWAQAGERKAELSAARKTLTGGA